MNEHEPDVDPDPFLNRHRPAPVTGEGWTRLVEAVREFQDVIGLIAPPDEVSLAAAERLTKFLVPPRWQRSCPRGHFAVAVRRRRRPDGQQQRR
jgi:hypothetical protein